MERGVLPERLVMDKKSVPPLFEVNWITDAIEEWMLNAHRPAWGIISEGFFFSWCFFEEGGVCVRTGNNIILRYVGCLDKLSTFTKQECNRFDRLSLTRVQPVSII